jgi:hypothetical protein
MLSVLASALSSSATKHMSAREESGHDRTGRRKSTYLSGAMVDSGEAVLEKKSTWCEAGGGKLDVEQKRKSHP